jgi:tetratricopeptide (TPR) repeat protein
MKFSHAFALAILLSACGGPMKIHQADHNPPQMRDLFDDTERALLKDAMTHSERADAARTSGNMDQAKAEWKAAADGWSHYAEKYQESSEWRLVARRVAAENYLRAEAAEEAAKMADAIRNDPLANEASKAYGARLSAGANQMLAAQEMKAGKIEQLKIRTAGERAREPLQPRTPPDSWKRFVESADAYLALAKTDVMAASPALLAAEVQYAYDNVEEARRRFEHVFTTWPGSLEAVDAASLYLQTFLLRKEDQDQYQGAVEKLFAIMHPEAEKAIAAGKSGDEAAKKKAERFAKLDEQLAREKEGTGFNTAKMLLDSGKPTDAAEAAALFEKFADEKKDSPDAPNALYNAGVAWDKAKKPEKAIAARQRVLKEYPESKMAPGTTLALAASLSKKRDRKGAAKLYGQYLEKWPQGEQRCLAILNMAIELDELRKKADAANQYKAFGSDNSCVKDDPNAAAGALYRAGKLFLDAKKKADAKEVLNAMVNLQGITNPVQKSQLEDARNRLKKMK